MSDHDETPACWLDPPGPHRWGTGRDRDECADCDAPRHRTPQPVAHAPDAAVVLAGLVQEMRTRAEQYDVQGTANTDLVAFGIARAINIVEATQQRQATSGARAAGGDDLISDVPPRGWCPECDGPSECAPGTCPGVGAPEAARGIHRLLDSVQAEARRLGFCCYAAAIAPNDPCPWHAASSTPSAPGVAALLAECARRQETYGDKWISIWQIRRLLAPEGADGEGKGS